MEKKDYLNLQRRYADLKNREEMYLKDLLKYIDEAFDNHDNLFEYKCDTHDTWEEKAIDEDFDAMDELPICLTVWIDDDGGHEIYPISIRQEVYGSGVKEILVDGWDWYDNDWRKNQQVYPTLSELESIAGFINAVLEQEQELNN